MLDFTELGSGNALELLVRELLRSKGFRVYWSGEGVDAGRDLVATEIFSGVFSSFERKWLVQCKNNADSGRAVGQSAIDAIVDSCAQHDADGYLLVVTTHLTSSLVTRLSEISNNPSNQIATAYWDSVDLIRLLDSPEHWRIAQQFFPISTAQYGAKVFATLTPNRWVVVHRGYYFHFSNRIGSQIGSQYGFQLSSVDRLIDDMESIKLAEKEFFRLRYIWHDDKNGCYTAYADFMHPNGRIPSCSIGEIESRIGSGCGDEYGLLCFWEIGYQEYLEQSDHYDPDHYSYYEHYDSDFRIDSRNSRIERRMRPDGEETIMGARLYRAESRESFEKEHREKSFDQLVDTLKKLNCIAIAHAQNSNIETLDKFCNRYDWAKIVRDARLDPDLFFSARIYFRVIRWSDFVRLLNKVPLTAHTHFRLTKVALFLPEKGYVATPNEETMHELTISVHPMIVKNKVQARELLNNYFDEISEIFRE